MLEAALEGYLTRSGFSLMSRLLRGWLRSICQGGFKVCNARACKFLLLYRCSIPKSEGHCRLHCFDMSEYEGIDIPASHDPRPKGYVFIALDILLGNASACLGDAEVETNYLSGILQRKVALGANST
jgi:hypothetical protein